VGTRDVCRRAPGRATFYFAPAAAHRRETSADALFEGAKRALTVAARGRECTELEEKRGHGATAAGVHRPGEGFFERHAIACGRGALRSDLGGWRRVVSYAGAREEVTHDVAGDPLEAPEIVGADLEHTAPRARATCVQIDDDDDVATFASDEHVVGPRQTFFEYEPRRHVGELTPTENTRAIVELETVARGVKSGEIRRLGVPKRPRRIGPRRIHAHHARRRDKAGGTFGMASVEGHAYLLAPATIMTNQEAITTPAAVAGVPPRGAWLLVIDPPVSARTADDGNAGGGVCQTGVGPAADEWFARRLLGLSVVLRLALTAQAAGARAIVLAAHPARDAVRDALRDDRLKVPVLDPDDPSLAERFARATELRAPANFVVHRAVMAYVSQAPVDLAAPDAVTSAARGAAGMYGFAPIAVVDRAAFETAQRALLRSLRKPQDGWTSTYLNRPVSLFITRRLVATHLRPNEVSVAILGVGLLGAFLASRGTYGALVAGAALFHAQSVLDGCDGEMSRLTFRGSLLGEWLDTVGDDLTNYGFFGGAAWGLYSATGQVAYLALGALTIFCGLLGSGLEYRYLVQIGSGDLLKYPLGVGKAPGGDDGPKSPVARVFDAIAPLFKRDTFVFLTLLGAVLGALGPLLAIFAVGALGVLIAVLKAELRMARERAQIRASASLVDPVGPRD
jgi:phosphatidylglycerophosphate synthase